MSLIEWREGVSMPFKFSYCLFSWISFQWSVHQKSQKIISRRLLTTVGGHWTRLLLTASGRRGIPCGERVTARLKGKEEREEIRKKVFFS